MSWLNIYEYQQKNIDSAFFHQSFAFGDSFIIFLSYSVCSPREGRLLLTFSTPKGFYSPPEICSSKAGIFFTMLIWNIVLSRYSILSFFISRTACFNWLFIYFSSSELVTQYIWPSMVGKYVLKFSFFGSPWGSSEVIRWAKYLHPSEREQSIYPPYFVSKLIWVVARAAFTPNELDTKSARKFVGNSNA